jgi:hypothetical protein
MCFPGAAHKGLALGHERGVPLMINGWVRVCAAVAEPACEPLLTDYSLLVEEFSTAILASAAKTDLVDQTTLMLLGVHAAQPFEQSAESVTYRPTRVTLPANPGNPMAKTRYLVKPSLAPVRCGNAVNAASDGVATPHLPAFRQAFLGRVNHARTR